MSEDAHRAYHEHLLGRMADVLGLDLDLEVDLTRLSRAQVERAVKRCMQCPDPSGCEIWLEEHGAGTDEAPQLCMNKALLEHLRDSY
ncbi:DUF6455 family protein [Maritimibacter sp. HL-12]|uniref:DUF6455 family protein n=1 Tax=Maritimibacter sp. HL-12 TaxID=1162418 RepID=UPI000A0EECDC|nr:DUF6455 family protein [Maritimibacter sp. HL-12]SMH49862.1 hypothetical protein SAMN05661107_2225 [Maritimibacter sp. HL-12]